MTETMTTNGQLAIALAVGSTDTALDRCMKRASNSFIYRFPIQLRPDIVDDGSFRLSLVALKWQNQLLRS
jgi:hypothetical protein